MEGMSDIAVRRREELLKELSHEELKSKVIQLMAHNEQLKNIIAKSKEAHQHERPGRPFDFSKCRKIHALFKFLYLGWDYQGYVVQEDTCNTVENLVIEALKKCKLIEKRDDANYHRCGRTDKGVSAFCQVISITVRAAEEGKPPINYCRILNRLLPENIRMISWSPVGEEMSARFDCARRTYRYFFPKGNLNLKAMAEAAEFLVGTHDFRNLCKMDVGNGVVNYKRCIHSAQFSFVNDTNDGYSMCQFILEGQAYLWHQVRCIMSVLFLVGKGLESPNIVKDLLDIEKNPRKPQYPMAHFVGLSLFDCHYDSVKWETDQDELSEVMKSLQGQWAFHAIKETHLRRMLIELEKASGAVLNHQSDCLLRKESKVYKRLLSRKTCNSLEEQIEHFKKKRKMESE